ncbi:D-2-hydroxyacid dehydrogenase [uncultured Kushneria sp.]|uniref:D-2-hydroxyacid dehydrogenase n=1 Tax=uncultured Kushneria sp. TaxID=905033 RepID=UPI00262ABA09|nr:D-2-hydroxyacid dehydrogenase [uncultured Kushneria sp.]
MVPEIELLRDQSLLPPMRHPADFAGDPDFRRTPEQEAQFDALLNEAEVLYGIPDVDPQRLAKVVEANPELRWVHVMAAGGGRRAGQGGRTLFRGAGAGDVYHLGRRTWRAAGGIRRVRRAGGRQAAAAHHGQRDHHWGDRWMMGQISEQTVLILGLGGIGREVARRLSLLDMHVLGVSRQQRMVPHVDEIIAPSQLRDAVRRADAIVIALPGTDATEGWIDAELLAEMKPGVTIVNVGRGTVIDEPALIEALQREHVGLAVLDVTASEPLDNASPLWDMPNVLLTPHTAALSDAEDRLIAEFFADNARRYLNGEALRNRVDTVEFY